MNIAYTLTNNSLVFILDGRRYAIDSSHQGFNELVRHLTKPGVVHDYDLIRRLANPVLAIEHYSDGDVKIVGDKVLYRGEEMHGSLVQKLLRVVQAGQDVTPLARFMANLQLNPNPNSRASLYNFLEKYATPITPDGHFIALKSVRPDFKDIHSGTLDYTPGKVVEEPRWQTDEDSNNTCSRGLHACASEYFGGTLFGGNHNKLIAVKINPRDVVAVPSDYRFSKLRACRLEVLEEITLEFGKELEQREYTNYDSEQGWTDYEHWGNPDDDWEEEPEFEEGEFVTYVGDGDEELPAKILGYNKANGLYKVNLTTEMEVCWVHPEELTD